MIIKSNYRKRKVDKKHDPINVRYWHVEIHETNSRLYKLTMILAEEDELYNLDGITFISDDNKVTH